jgi:methionyl-tRNA formyltransferase
MALQVVFFGNSASTFSARHFAALQDAPCALEAVVDVPPTKRVTTNPLPPDLPNFLEVARQRSVPCFEPARAGDPAFVAALRSLTPDLFVSAGYALILKDELLGAPRLLAANFHASLLPAYRGKHPVFWTLRGGERWAGLTVHAMDPGIDTGDILYQVKVRTRRDDTVATLYERIMERSTELVSRLVADAAHGDIPRRPQPQGSGAYFSSTTDADFCIDWTWPAEKIRRTINMTPGECFVEVRGQRIYLAGAEAIHPQIDAPPGVLLRLGRTRATVAAQDGAISLGKARFARGEMQPVATLLRTLGLAPGDSLR